MATTLPMTALEDSTLIAMTLAGDNRCFDVLADRHSGAIRRRLMRFVRNPTDADDVMQEVLLKAWRRLSDFRSESSFRTWLTSIAVNEARGLHRSARRHVVCQMLTDFDVLASPEEPADRQIGRVQEIENVRQAITTLPPKYREVIVFRELEELTGLETARLMHSSVERVKTRLFRARRLLSLAVRRHRASRWLKAAA